MVYMSLRAQYGHEPLLNAVASRLNKKVVYFYAPNFEKVGSILVSACAFVRSSVRPSVRPVKTEFKLGF